MPAESARLSRPIGRRDRRLMAVLAAAGVLLAGGGAAYATLHSGHGSADERCVVVPAAGVMGGGDWHYCSTRPRR
ncbi:MAG TPA: hypothetical protein VHC67_11600 [Gaiellaceae bacterium]|jgi:hypothetical protein|nr:hypothetical protein [Gaiellaceae bacterium]